ncbi:MAG: hypothetical protein ACKVVP_14300 [Chloroflexota bacterium]
MATPRPYNEFTWLWLILSPPQDFADEARVMVEQLHAGGMPDGGSIPHLGLGAGIFAHGIR